MKKILFMLLMITCLGLTCGLFAQELSVSTPQEVYAGETFNVSVRLSADEVFGAAFDLKFNKSIITALSVDEGSFIKQCSERTYGMFPPKTDNLAGKIKFGDLCLGKNISGTGVIGVITFKALTPGASDLSLDNAKIYGESGIPVPDIEIKNGSVKVKSGEYSQNGTVIVKNRAKHVETETVTEQEINETINALPPEVVAPPANDIEVETINATVFPAGKRVSNASAVYGKATEYAGSNGTAEETKIINVTTTAVNQAETEDKVKTGAQKQGEYDKSINLKSSVPGNLLLLCAAILLVLAGLIIYAKIKK